MDENQAAELPTIAIDSKKLAENAITIWSLTLPNGLVLQVGEPWPGPDGEPALPYEDKEGAQQYVLVGGIFFKEKTIETTTETDEDGNTNTTSLENPAHYLAWTEPCTSMRRMRVEVGPGVYAEASVPFKHAVTEIHESMLDSLTVDPEEASEDEDEDETAEAEATPTPQPHETAAAPIAG